MKLFIVATPLFDSTMTVGSYRLRDQTGDRALTVKNDFRGITEAMTSPGLDLIRKIGVEPFAADKPLFVDINRILLFKCEPMQLRNVAPGRLVCVIPGGMVPDEEVLGHCRTLKEHGYAIALENFPLAGISSPFFEFASYLIIRYKDARLSDIARSMSYQFPNIRLVITEVPDNAAYQKLSQDRDTRRALFSGEFYTRPITEGVIQVSPLKVNALQLMREINTEDFELSDISQIIGRDPSLTISLLRFINSHAAGLSRRVESIQSAVAIMGQQEVRRWGTIAISVNLAEDRPGEVTRLSLIRAKFAENLAGAFELGIFQNQLFLAGLFSLLDVILRKPMELAIKEVAVDEQVRMVLVEKAGNLAPVFNLIYAYEHADWDKVSIMMVQNNLKIEQVSTAFIEALTWYEQLLTSLEEPEENLDGNNASENAAT